MKLVVILPLLEEEKEEVQVAVVAHQISPKRKMILVRNLDAENIMEERVFKTKEEKQTIVVWYAMKIIKLRSATHGLTRRATKESFFI